MKTNEGISIHRTPLPHLGRAGERENGHNTPTAHAHLKTSLPFHLLN